MFGVDTMRVDGMQGGQSGRQEDELHVVCSDVQGVLKRVYVSSGDEVQKQDSGVAGGESKRQRLKNCSNGRQFKK